MLLYGVFDPVDAFFLQVEDLLKGRFGLVREVFWHHGITEYLNGRGKYLGLLESFSAIERLPEIHSDLLSYTGTHGRPSQYAGFYKAMVAVTQKNMSSALRLADQMEDWENPGWQFYRSKIYHRLNMKSKAYQAASSAFHGAPDVYEHAIQYAKSAIACGDQLAVRRLLLEQPKGTYNHANYDRFVEFARGWIVKAHKA